MEDKEIERGIMFAVRKKDKYLFRYQNKKAEWTYAIDRANLFFDYEWANNFAGLTKGCVVSVELIVRECRK